MGMTIAPPTFCLCVPGEQTVEKRQKFYTTNTRKVVQMNLLELKNLVDFAIEGATRYHQDPEKITVYIPSYKTGWAGHLPCTGVKSAHKGFDWESSSFLIFPEKELREIDRDEIKVLRDKYEELSWSHYKVSKIKKENETLKQKLEDLQKSQS